MQTGKEEAKGVFRLFFHIFTRLLPLDDDLRMTRSQIGGETKSQNLMP